MCVLCAMFVCVSKLIMCNIPSKPTISGGTQVNTQPLAIICSVSLLSCGRGGAVS